MNLCLTKLFVQFIVRTMVSEATNERGQIMVGKKLVEMLNQGHVWVDGQSYMGKAADGVEIELGLVGYEMQIEEYLVEHCGPANW